jgi:uncharacterized protein
MGRRALIGLGIVLVAVVAVLFLVWTRQERMVFFPGRGLSATPASIGLPFDSVQLVTADGVALSAWWVPVTGSRGTVVFCHGNAGTMADRLERLRYFHSQGLDALYFDYRGYGESAGAPSERGTYLDMDAAVDHVLQRRGGRLDRAVFWGESLGGAVAVEAATRRRPALLVVESSFASIRAMARHHYPFLPVFLATRVRYDSLARVGGLECPLLVLHSPTDTLVPVGQGQALLAAAPGRKWFAALEGDHNDGGVLVSPLAQVVVRGALDECLSPR